MGKIDIKELTQSKDNDGFEAFDEHVDIKLFNETAEFIMMCAENKAPGYASLKGKFIWYQRANGNNIQDAYGVQYPGELLERYEEKPDTSIRQTRAIALALGGAADSMDKSMFNNKQREKFIEKIKKLAKDDLWLQAALFTLGEPIPGSKMSNMKYERTEEILFALALSEAATSNIQAVKQQVTDLLGKDRTMLVYGNLRIYDWVLRLLSTLTLSNGKNDALFRALLKLPTMYAKPGSMPYSTLLTNGYTDDEILYLNACLPSYQPVSGSLMRNSITTEKLATAYCIAVLNNELPQHPDMYRWAAHLFEKYNKFNVKFEGNKGLYDAVKNNVTIKNLQTYLFANEIFDDKELLVFDIMDPKYDQLYNELDHVGYTMHFERQLVQQKRGIEKTKLEQWLAKFEQITGTQYVSVFNEEYSWSRKGIFNLLVSNKIVDLKTEYQTAAKVVPSSADKPENRPAKLVYISELIKGVENREAFDFFRWYLSSHSFIDMICDFTGSTNKAEIEKYMSAYFVTDFFKGRLYTGPKTSYYGYGSDVDAFNIKRDFLTDDEHRELFGWLDDYIHSYHTEEYAAFTATALLSSFIQKLYPQQELRGIYEVLIKFKGDKWVDMLSDKLNNVYMTNEEKEAVQIAKKREEQKQEQLKEAKKLAEFKAKLDELKDGKISAALNQFSVISPSFAYKRKSREMVMERAMQMLERKQYMLDAQEIADILVVCGELVEYGDMSYEDVKTLIIKIKEVKTDDEDAGSAEIAVGAA